MDAATLFYTIVSIVGGILIGVIAYFLKRTISLVDRCEKDIKELDKTKASKEEFCAFKNDVKGQFEKLTKDIECIREDYITKDDFFREQAKTDRKLDMILDILLGRKGQNNG
jgi:hypothetical protein